MNALLRVFSLFSCFACRIKNFLYALRLLRPSLAPLPIISVGSIALGGTEKTPIAMEILRWLKEKGRRPALLSRGYRGRWEKTGGVVSDGKNVLATWEQAGDEPFMVARAVPGAGVLVGKNRLASSRRASELGFDIAVLDDGFQHRRLARNLDIAVSPPPEKMPLREPRSSLNRADIILIPENFSSFSPPPFSRRLGLPARKKVFSYSVIPKGFFSLSTQKIVAADELSKKRVLGFCAIARPNRFFSLLEATGVRIISSLIFPDHHSYPDSTLQKIIRKLQTSGAEAAVTTEKDAVKILGRLNGFKNIPVYCLRVAIQIDPGFYSTLEKFLASSPISSKPFPSIPYYSYRIDRNGV